MTDAYALDACDRAAETLRSLGFVLVYTSRRSEACYYGLSGYLGVIRVAAHRQSDRTDRDHPADAVVAKVTFGRGQPPVGDARIENAVVTALGRFLLANLRQQRTQEGTTDNYIPIEQKRDDPKRELSPTETS